MPAETLIVAVAQTSAEPGDVSANAQSAAAVVADAAGAGAKLLVFPELSLVGYDLALLSDPSAWVTEDDPRLDAIRHAAREYGVTAVVGAAYRGPDGEPWIASLAVGPGGRIRAYGKHCLHGAERDLFRPGAEHLLLEIDGWRIALAVCYDAAVPAHAQEAARRGADVYAASALYTRGQERRLDVHFAARAMDHRMFAVAANLAGAGPGWESCGGSGAWHPDGGRLSRAGTDPCLVTTPLPRAELEALRARDALGGYPRGTGAA
ncbi:carbon-nitrogen hydrolase family protein [Planobispora longispora]|uniref:Carbon-nitrogen hydrolase family protein n=1 Tax=Planobispora longispora TaxID=28887 RepID=A0A8J3S0T7_9ACTN|nr:carbon-nitrogen hydrolase family protein [Planobispora longispora]BFE78442.1 carbon-nitrogen hydrolase family protein [Planobispora longispora]GIH81583.1 carbon-nitrogen hydrolase family protein [Planobispora longispora]